MQRKMAIKFFIESTKTQSWYDTNPFSFLIAVFIRPYYLTKKCFQHQVANTRLEESNPLY